MKHFQQFIWVISVGFLSAMLFTSCADNMVGIDSTTNSHVGSASKNALAGFTTAAVETGEIPASGDTYLRAGAANTNEGASPFLRMQASGDNRILVKFDQSAIEGLIGVGGTLVSAQLKFDISENADNWGKDDDRTLDVHRMLRAWTEGNGKNAGLPGAQSYRGDGPGATWNCATDADVANQKPDCAGDAWEMGKPKQVGIHPWDETGPTATQLMTNGQSGTVCFDVTLDVAAFLANPGDNKGWLVKKTNEGQSGHVEFYSRENGSIGPRLVIEYIPPAPPPPPPPSTLFSQKDAFLRSGAGNTNEGGNYGLRIAASGDNRVVVGFGSITTTGLVSAKLVLTLADNADNWGGGAPGTRFVDAHPLAVSFTEGTEAHADQAPDINTGGAGVTWNCANDPDVSNTNSTGCVGLWEGGGDISGPNPKKNNLIAPTASGVLHFNTQAGEVMWDVTADVLNGYTQWLVKKRDEGASGRVNYYSKEGAANAGNPNLAPRLVLTYN